MRRPSQTQRRAPRRRAAGAEAARAPSAATWRRLEREALRVRERAYAPYSRFLVGAALLGGSGRVYTGCNVENSSYGLAVCAERGAISRAVADGERAFAALVIATQSAPPSPPCGMCRQSLAEFAPGLPILLVNPQGDRVRTTLDQLLPMSFTKSYL